MDDDLAGDQGYDKQHPLEDGFHRYDHALYTNFRPETLYASSRHFEVQPGHG